MPRGPRLDAPDALHHVIARGIERRAIFEHDGDRQGFLDRLARSVEPTHTGLLAWCLMPNHVHLLLRTGRAPLSTVMRRGLGGYAVQHYGLTLTATAAALSVSKLSVLRGVTAGDQVLATAGWTAADLLRE